MTVQININDLKARAFELEIERSAIRELLKLYTADGITKDDELAFLKSRQLPPALQITATNESENVVMEDKPLKRHYKKRTTTGASKPVAAEDPDLLKGLSTIGKYIGVKEGLTWWLKKNKGLPVKEEGKYSVARKQDLQRWVEKHPKYKIADTIHTDHKIVPDVHADESGTTYTIPVLSGRTKMVNKRCKGCNIMIHRVVPEDFNTASIQFHSPECKKEWEIDHKGGKS